MILYKNCKRAHNIEDQCETLRLGTLYGYRSAEDPSIRDEHEGVYHFSIDVPEAVTLSAANAKIVIPMFTFSKTLPTPFRGAMAAHFDRINIIRSTGENVTFKISGLSIERHAPDQFIFCMSLHDSRPDSISNNYDSYWSAPYEKVTDFAEGLRREVLKAILLDPNAVEGLNKDQLDSIEVTCKHDVIAYTARNFSTALMPDAALDDLISKIANIAFVKPEHFSKEYEYRFAFEIKQGENYFVPSAKSLMVSSRFAKDMLSQKTD